jgi:hypothetical protein
MENPRSLPADLAGTASGAVSGRSFTIDCDQCVMQHTDACSDCVVTFICSREPGDALVVDVGEYRALRMLSESGLVPELRHRRRIS